MSLRISTYRNEHGYWVAKIDDGDYKGTKSWSLKKKTAVRILETVVGLMDKAEDNGT